MGWGAGQLLPAWPGQGQGGKRKLPPSRFSRRRTRRSTLVWAQLTGNKHNRHLEQRGKRQHGLIRVQPPPPAFPRQPWGSNLRLSLAVGVREGHMVSGSRRLSRAVFGPRSCLGREFGSRC